MSINLSELSELIEKSSKAGVAELFIAGDKAKVVFASSKKFQSPNSSSLQEEPEAPQDEAPIIISPELARKIAEIREHEEELNKMIEHPADYEEELARMENHDLEDTMPAEEGEGES